MDTHASAPPLTAIFILSASALAYEVLLVRMFSIIQWHHFAFMVISIALLGYGASGSFITVFQRRLLHKYEVAFLINILLFGVVSIFSFIAVQKFPFNSLEILWDERQWLRLMMTYLLLALPFFFASNAIALSMIRFYARLPLVYGIDLIGAGTGAIAVMLVLQIMPAHTTLRILSICGIVAGIFAVLNFGGRTRAGKGAIVIILLFLVIALPDKRIELRLSEYKALEQSLLIKGAERLEQYGDSVSRLDVVRSFDIPVRFAPGMSMRSPVETPPQLIVFSDGDEMNVIDHAVNGNSLSYRDYMTSALPYYVMESPRSVLVFESGTGGELHQAVSHQAKQVIAVEEDEKYTELISERYAGFYGWKYISDRVSVFKTSSRGFAASTETKYDLIVFAIHGASSGGAAGVHALATSYTWTIDALVSYIARLKPGGLLSITMWTSSPPRSNLRLFATVAEAMRRSGYDKADQNIAWIRSWNTATLLVKNGRLTQAETDNIRRFCEQRAYDIAWLPGIQPDETNRYQLLQQPVFYMAARELLSSSGAEFIGDYKYNIEPVTDDSPYFDNFFKWESLPELISMPARGGIAMIGVGYPTLLVTLLQASIAAIVLILLPLFFVKKHPGRASKLKRHIVVYFICIGLAFLFIEIAFIQKFTLILSQPIYAVALVLFAFLLFSGAGSLYVQWRLENKNINTVRVLLTGAILAISLITLTYLALLPIFSASIMAMPDAARIMIAFVLCSPLAFFMGMPLSLGMAATRESEPRLVPWAWGINGCASVMSAVLAILLAIEIGFSGLMLVAVVLYLLAWLSYRRLHVGS